MSITITRVPASSTTIPNPVAWMDYASSRSSGTTAHTLIGGGIAVTHQPAALRRTRLRFLYESEYDARTCEVEHGKGGMFKVTHLDRDTAEMSYVVVGEITRTLDPETASVWLIDLDVQEVPW